MAQLFPSQRVTNAFYKEVASLSTFSESDLQFFVGEQSQLYVDHPAYPPQLRFPASQLPLGPNENFSVGLPWNDEQTQKDIYASVGKRLAGDSFAPRVKPDPNALFTGFWDVMRAVEHQVNRVASQSVMAIVEHVYLQRGVAQSPVLPDQNKPTYVTDAAHRTVLLDIVDMLPSVFMTLTIDRGNNNIDAMKAVATNRELVDVILNSVLSLEDAE